MPEYIQKVLLSSQDKPEHERHSDCLLNLHAPVVGAYGFRVCSAHIPCDQGTFSFYENTLEYQLSSSYTFPNIKKIQFRVINLSTGSADLDNTIELSNATYTNSALNTLFTNNFNYSGINSWSVSSNTITADFNATTYARSVEMIAYNHNDEKTNHDFLNIDYNPKTLPKAETFNTDNNRFNYVLEEMFTFPHIKKIIVKYDDPTTGAQLDATLELSSQKPVFDSTEFLSMLNTEFSTKLLATFTANINSQTGLYSLILTGTSSSTRNRIINITAYDNNNNIMEDDGHLNLKSVDLFVQAGQNLPITTLTTFTSLAGKLTFNNSKLNTVAFNLNQVYTSQQIVDQLNTLDEPANTAITFSKTGDTLIIDNDTPNLSKTFLYVSKVELQITTPTKSTIQTLYMENLPDTLNANSLEVYFNMYLTGNTLAGNEPGQVLTYDITGSTLSITPPAYNEDRTFTFSAYNMNNAKITGGNINLPGTPFTIAANSTSAANITTNISFPSTTGINASYANSTLTPRGSLSFDPSQVLGFTSGGVVVNTSSPYQANTAITLANNSDIDINFTTTMDISSKIGFNHIITKLNFDEYETYTETTLLQFLNSNFSNFTWSFDDHRLKVVSSNSNILRLYKNEKLGLTFKNKDVNFIDIPANGTYTAEAVLNGSTHIMSYLGLSFYNNSICSKKHRQAHANDIVATLHNRSRMTYGDYLEMNEPGPDIVPINTSQFQSIRVRSYNPNYQIIPNQHLPTHVEVNIYCRT